MKACPGTLLLAMICGCLCSCSPTNPEVERQKVRDCFSQYARAAVEGNEPAAAGCISTQTRRLYAKILSLALNGSESEIKALTPFEIMAVLNARHRLEPKTLQHMTADALAISATNQRWEGNEGLRDLAIGQVEIQGNLGRGNILSSGQPTRTWQNFLNEGGNWKLDVASHADRLSHDLVAMAEARNMSLVEFIYLTLEAVNGKKPSEEIWKPINETAAK